MSSVSGAPDDDQITRVLDALTGELRAVLPGYLAEGLLMILRALAGASDELAALDAVHGRRSTARRRDVAEQAIAAYRVALGSMAVVEIVTTPDTPAVEPSASVLRRELAAVTPPAPPAPGRQAPEPLRNLTRPDDVPTMTPLPAVVEAHAWYSAELLNATALAPHRDTPPPAERTIGSLALGALAAQHALADRALWSRWCNARDALAHGATVDEVAAAMGLDVDEVAMGLRTWVDGQLDLRESLGGCMGIDADEHAAVLALIGPRPAPASCPSCKGRDVADLGGYFECRGCGHGWA